MRLTSGWVTSGLDAEAMISTISIGTAVSYRAVWPHTLLAVVTNTAGRTVVTNHSTGHIA